MSSFNGKSVLITGAGSGIGRATALAFAGVGAKVLVADIDPAGGEEAVRQVLDSGGEAAFARCDVADEDSARRAVDAATDRFGRLDFAANCAAIDPEIHAEPSWDIDILDRILRINLRGTVLCLKAEIAAMRAGGGGAIVNMASLAGIRGYPNKPFYSASKHAVVGLTRSAALEHARHGVRINAIAPGFIETPMAMANLPNGNRTLSDVAERNPSGRVGQPGEIAAAILYLCSPEAGYIVGQTLSLDGGISAG